MIVPSDFRDKVFEKLREKGIRFECELCGKNDWSLVERPVAVRLSHSGFTIPSANLICNNCGNMRLFALGALGLFEEPEGVAAEREPAYP